MNGGNGDYVEYTYDKLDRVSYKKYNGTNLGFWGYNANGQVGYFYDYASGKIYYYFYDSIGRFINADGYVTTDVLGLLSSNMFAYCTNNPVNYYDSYGFLETRNDGYDGNAAAAYAIKWAYIRNPNLYSYGQDCTNFVSQCLFAGGFKMDDSWHSYRELTTT